MELGKSRKTSFNHHHHYYHVDNTLDQCPCPHWRFHSHWHSGHRSCIHTPPPEGMRRIPTTEEECLHNPITSQQAPTHSIAPECPSPLTSRCGTRCHSHHQVTDGQ